MIAAALPANGSANQVHTANGKRCRARRKDGGLAGDTAVRGGSPDPAVGPAEGLRVTPGGETCGQEGCGVGRPAHNTGEPAASDGKATKKRREWQPEARDHLIYRWVKFDGQTQAHTAADFGISQATVSRIIDRYERWQAHADPREGGRLDPAERLRAQPG